MIKAARPLDSIVAHLEGVADFCNNICQFWTHGPQQTASSFDHLVGARDKRHRRGEAEHFGGLEVDDKLEFGRLLHRKVGRMLALEDTIDVAGRLPKLVGDVDSIGREPAVDGKKPGRGRPRAAGNGSSVR